MEEQASAGGCAYCAEPLDPFQRCYCATCCPGAGAVAPWFSCRSCAAQRNEAGGDAAGQHVVKWRRVEQAGAGTPCFEAGHCLVQVVPPGSGWLTLQPGPEQGRLQRLRRFLREYRVSRAPQGVAWIAVRSSEAQAVGELAEADHGGALADWEVEKDLGTPSAASAQQIGRRRGILTGKWMVHASEAAEEDMWEAVARAVYVEGLCPSAKIAAGPVQGERQTRVICIYTRDFQHRDDVMRVHAGLSAALRAALPDRGSWLLICYKPDIYTTLGIYHARPQTNPWKIKPTIFAKKL